MFKLKLELQIIFRKFSRMCLKAYIYIGGNIMGMLWYCAAVKSYPSTKYTLISLQHH